MRKAFCRQGVSVQSSGGWFYIVAGQRMGPVWDHDLRAMVRDGRLEPEARGSYDSVLANVLRMSGAPALASG